MADNEEIQLTRTEARGGSPNHVLRYILPISLGLVVFLFILLLVVYR